MGTYQMGIQPAENKILPDIQSLKQKEALKLSPIPNTISLGRFRVPWYLTYEAKISKIKTNEPSNSCHMEIH